jgi:type VI protein secretion system component Hcp
MGKLIIENRSKVSDIEALQAVQMVMESGRISNQGKQYCYFSTTLNNLGIASFLNKKSDRFVVVDNE